MGRLGDIARNQSKFVQLDIGESVELEFVSFTETISQFDPEKTTMQYKFLDEHQKHKFWTNGSGKVMRVMDTVQKGDRVRITRNKLIDKNGVEQIGKSDWSVEKL